MKKCIILLFALVTTSAFAQGTLGVGAGGLFDFNRVSGLETYPDNDHITVENLSFGGFGFFNLKNMELDVSFAYGLLTARYVDKNNEISTGSILQLGFDLLFKIPFDPGGPILIFPLLGLGYNMLLPGSDDEWFSQIGAMAGVGVDYFLNYPFFLRAEILLHARLAGWTMSSDDRYLIHIGAGPRVKVAIGYGF